jgi:AAA family ATP:ADP antiporter
VTTSNVDQAAPLDRALRLFTDVRAGEGVTALLLALNVLLLLCAYYMLKIVREALILSHEGAVVKSYVAAGQALLLLVLVPAYGALADRLPRRRLLNAVSGFFILCLMGFWAVAHAGVPVGVPFFLWVGIFNLMIVAQFWSFANDLYTKDQGERLFPIVAFGASLGAVVGSLLTKRLIPLVGVPQLLLVAAALLAIAAVLSHYVDARERRHAEAGIPHRFTTAAVPAATGEYEVVTRGEKKAVTLSRSGLPPRPGTFRLVFGDRYLLLIALMILVLNWVNTTGEYILSSTLTAAAKAAVAKEATGVLSEAEFIGAFYSQFNFVVSTVGILLQLFVVSRLFKYFGVQVAVLVAPILAMIGYPAIAFFPVLSVVRAVKIAENANDYSLQNTVRNVLFLPTSREQKYKAKQVIDSFFVRIGDVLSAVLVFVGTSQLRFGTSQFAKVNVVLALCWLVLAVLVGRAYRQKTAGLA